MGVGKLFNGRVSVLQDEKVLEFMHNNVHILNTVHLNMIKMVNFMLCVLYHNFF